VSLPPWHAHVDVWLVLGSVVAAYLTAVRRHDRELPDRAHPPEEPTPRRKVHLFLLGMAVLWLGADWPIHDLAERYLFSVHMVQHTLFSLVAAPILLAGMPVWLLRRLLGPRWIRSVWAVVTRPVVALVLFNGVLFFMHWPAVVQVAVTNELAHFGLHVLLVGSALVMWWPILSPLPEMPPLPAPGQMLYLFLESLAPTIPASFLTFGTRPLYPVYATFPRIWGMGVLTDQLVAGLIMKLVGGLILWGVIAAVFFRWGQRERRDGFDALRYTDVEREIRAEMSR
jgi:putative membrane protein